MTCQKISTQESLDKQRLEYKRLRAYEARLNYEMHLMKKRIVRLAMDEEKLLARRVLFTSHLEELYQMKANLADEAWTGRARRKKNERVEKMILEARGRWHSNEWHISVMEKKKRKDNPIRLILKEAKRDQVRVRAQVAYTTWQQLEQQLQREEADFETFKAKQWISSPDNVIPVFTKKGVPAAPVVHRERSSRAQSDLYSTRYLKSCLWRSYTNILLEHAEMQPVKAKGRLNRISRQVSRQDVFC